MSSREISGEGCPPVDAQEVGLAGALEQEDAGLADAVHLVSQRQVVVAQVGLVVFAVPCEPVTAKPPLSSSSISDDTFQAMQRRHHLLKRMPGSSKTNVPLYLSEGVRHSSGAHPSGSLMKSMRSFPLVSGASATMSLTRFTQLATKESLS